MKGEIRIVNGDEWMVVDIAPALQLAEMVAALLEDAGFIVMVRGGDSSDDVFSHLGSPGIGVTHVLVPKAQGEEALQLIRDTVTDYEGDELEAVLQAGGADAVFGFDSDDEDDEDDEDYEDDDDYEEEADLDDDADDSPAAAGFPTRD